MSLNEAEGFEKRSDSEAAKSGRCTAARIQFPVSLLLA
jgi:hypothetical protein